MVREPFVNFPTQFLIAKLSNLTAQKEIDNYKTLSTGNQPASPGQPCEANIKLHLKNYSTQCTAFF